MVASDDISRDGGTPPAGPSDGAGIAGRDDELSSLRAALEDVLAGRGRLTWIVGEAGIGKTCLAEELAEDARRNGANVLWSRCWDGEGVPELFPWIRLVQGCLRSVDEATLRTLVGPHSNELTGLVAHSAEPGSEQSSSGVRFRVFNAIAHLLDEYSRLAPLLVILEDLHLSDPHSLLLLHFFAQEQRQRPLLLLSTYREPAAVANAELTRTVVATMREPGTERLELSGLDSAGTQRLLSSVLGREPTAEFATALQRRTGGNPLFLREFARQLATPSGSAMVDWPRPEDLFINAELAELVEQRLATLSDQERAVLSAAAALGSEFRADALSQIDGPVPDRITASLRAAERCRVLVHGAEAGTLRFAQTLVRDQLLEQAAARETSDRQSDEQISHSDSIPAPATDAASMRKEGEFWTVTFAGRTCRMRDSKGLEYVAFLLRHPGRPIHVSEVVHLGSGGPSGSSGKRRVDESTAVRRGLGDAGAALDQQAKAAYKRRYEELHSELDEARHFNDLGGIERIEREMEFLMQEINSATGLGGRDRRTGSDVERARVNVTRSISRAVQKLDKVHPELARHLDQTLRTGTFCTYVAEPATARTWDL